MGFRVQGLGFQESSQIRFLGSTPRLVEVALKANDPEAGSVPT